MNNSDPTTLAEQLDKNSEDELSLSFEYLNNRRLYAGAKKALLVLIAKHIPKDSSSFENKLPKLLQIEEIAEEAQRYIEEFHDAEAQYKGLEKVIDAYAGRRSAIQSLMKYNLMGERGYHD